MSTDVMAVLENAQTRLAATQQRSDEVEAHARRILELLAHETTVWREAIEQEREFSVGITTQLGKRWSELDARIGELTARSTQEWTTLGDGLKTHWETVEQRWADCAINLQEMKLTLDDHQQHCDMSGEDHQGFISSHITLLDTAGERARNRVIVDGQTIGATFAGKSAECEIGIDVSITQHGEQIVSTGNEIRSRKDQATSLIEQIRTEFDSDMDDKYSSFESSTNQQIEQLKQAAESTKNSMETASEAIGDITSTLVEGADEVVDVLNLTNVGLSAVVGIVQNAIDICEEIIDCWES